MSCHIGLRYKIATQRKVLYASQIKAAWCLGDLTFLLYSCGSDLAHSHAGGACRARYVGIAQPAVDVLLAALANRWASSASSSLTGRGPLEWCCVHLHDLLPRKSAGRFEKLLL